MPLHDLQFVLDGKRNPSRADLADPSTKLNAAGQSRDERHPQRSLHRGVINVPPRTRGAAARRAGLGPLSLQKIESVDSATPSAFTASRIWPTRLSISTAESARSSWPVRPAKSP